MKKVLNIAALWLFFGIWSTARATPAPVCSKIHLDSHPFALRLNKSTSQELEKQHQRFLVELKKNGINPDFSNSKNRFEALKMAVKTGDPVLLGALSKQGFKNDMIKPQVDPNGAITLVHEALKVGQIDNVIFLLRQIQDTTVILKDSKFWNSLAQGFAPQDSASPLASEREFLSVMQLLADRNAIPKDTTQDSRYYGYQYAILYRMNSGFLTPSGFDSLLQILIRSGVDIHSSQAFGNFSIVDTVLFYGGPKAVEFFKVLMKYKVLANGRSQNFGQSYFQMACGNNVRLARFLMENGADIHPNPNGNGLTPLMHLAKNTESDQFDEAFELAKILIRKGVSANTEIPGQETALVLAMNSYNMKLIDLLATVTDLRKTKSVDSILKQAVEFGSIKLIQRLEKSGLDINAKTNSGQSLFHLAIVNEKTEVVKFLFSRQLQRIQNREAVKLDHIELVWLLTSTLRELDPSSTKQTIDDLSIEDVVKALQKIESEHHWNGVKLSKIVYDRVQRRDVGVELIKGFLATERDFKPVNSMQIFSRMTGLPFEVMNTNKYSEKTLGDFFEITLSLQAGASNPIFQNSKVDPQLLMNAQLPTLGHYLSRIRIVTLVSEIKADQVFNELPEITIEKLQEIEKKRLARTMVQAFQRMFSDPGMKFSYEQFMELYQKWGDIEPVMTLLARYNQTEEWKKNIPLLVEVFKSSLANQFDDFKFGSKNAKSAEQLKGLSESQIAEWMKPRAKVSLAPKPEMDPKLFEGLRNQVLGDLKSRTTIVPQSRLTGLAQEAMSLKMAPKQIIQKLMVDRGLSQEQVVGQIYSDLFHILLTTKDVGALRKSVDWLRTLAIQEPRIVKNGDTDGFNQLLLGLRQSIEAISSQSAEGPILLSVVSHDPKFLLMLGDLVQATSCQNYRTGSVIGTLLGYVTDANVQAMVSYVITEPFFKTPADFRKIQIALANGHVAETAFDGNKRIVRFSLKSGEVVETQNLGYGYLRNALKLGHRENGTPGIFLERDYAQNHPNLEQMKAQHKILLKEIAKAAHTEVNGALSIAGSRSPGGIYSDAGGGQKHGIYSVNIPLMEP